LLALAHRAALAIENARLYADSEGRRKELEALYRADETLHRSLRLDDVLRALVDVAVDVLHAHKSAVHVFDDERRELLTRAARGYSPETMAISLRVGEDIILPGDAEESADGLLVVTDARTDPRLHIGRSREVVAREDIRSAIGAPITVSGQ